MKETFLSIVIPVYQNAANLPQLFNALAGVAAECEGTELVFVDDGSTDGSSAILASFHETRPDLVRVVTFTKNFGQNAAIQAGLLNSSGKCAAIISADMQDPPHLIQEMIAKWKSGFPVVIGTREERDDSLGNRLFANLFWEITRRYAIKNYPKGGFDFCLLDRQVIDLVNQTREKNTHIFGLIFSLGFPFATIAYHRQKRSHGKSQWTFSKKFKTAIDTLLGFSYLPVRLISFVGVTVSAASFLFAAYAFTNYFVMGSTSHVGWTSIVVLISFIGGLTLLILGVIGEYLWRILDQSRPRPFFVVLRKLERSQQ